MPRKKSTTIVLNESVQKIKDELSNIYGLKNTLSAGLLLFSELSDAKQKEAIKRLKSLDKIDKKHTEKTPAVSDALIQLKQSISENPGEIIKILSPEEQKILQSFLDTVKPDSEPHKHKSA